MRANQARRNGRRVMDPRQLAFSIIVTGSEPGKVEEMLLWNDLGMPPQNELNTAVQEVCRRIIDMAQESMTLVREAIDRPVCISFDGSWEHRRNASRCLFTVIEQRTGRVMDSVVISRKVDKDDLTFCAVPNMMEAKGLSLLIPRLMQNPHIRAYVHDNDAKARKMIRQAGWEIEEYLDPGHCFKAFERKFQKFNSSHGGVLKDLEGSLKKWMRTVIKSNHSADEKARMWKDCVGHFLGDHRLCYHEPKACKVWQYHDDERAVSALKEFLEKTQFIVRAVSPEFSTQTNESFHLLKLRYATKDIKWGPTWHARVMCAVLDRNCPFWKEILYYRMELPALSLESLTKLRKDEEQRLARKRWVHSEEYIERQFWQRKVWRRALKYCIRNVDPEQTGLAYKINPYHTTG